jgi:toxin ParE1/3/4
VTLEVRYHPQAVAELVRAREWYEAQGRGLGDRFLAASEAELNRIGRWPHAGTPVVSDGEGTVVNRKTPIGGFPWAIGYEVSTDAVIVLAVFHQHRDPGYWTGRQP